VIPDHLGGIWCADFLEGVLSLLLEDVPINDGDSMWFQHGGAPCHSSCRVYNQLNNHFPDTQISLGVQLSWAILLI
jgi:hypothetical protein